VVLHLPITTNPSFQKETQEKGIYIPTCGTKHHKTSAALQDSIPLARLHATAHCQLFAAILKPSPQQLDLNNIPKNPQG
jgi:hypothetical protein